MHINEFDYHLPESSIATRGSEPRDHSNLLIASRSDKHLDHKKFFDIIDYLNPGDVLILNNSKVFKARVFVNIEGRSAKYEVIITEILERGDSVEIKALIKHSRKARIGKKISFPGNLSARVLEKELDHGLVTMIDEDSSAKDWFSMLDEYGEVPLPPYIENEGITLEEYETQHAEKVGSVATPTAGRHFTEELIQKIEAKGIFVEYITLHVGIGTFQPVWVENIHDHKMHQEYAELSCSTASKIINAKKSGKRVFAVGTTTVRTLEGFSAMSELEAKDYSGYIDIYITPGFEFKVVDALITNFHLPKSTLLMMISAFMGHDFMKSAYSEAIKRNYRFYSLGDAMLIE